MSKKVRLATKSKRNKNDLSYLIMPAGITEIFATVQD